MQDRIFFLDIKKFQVFFHDFIFRFLKKLLVADNKIKFGTDTDRCGLEVQSQSTNTSAAVEGKIMLFCQARDC